MAKNSVLRRLLIILILLGFLLLPFLIFGETLNDWTEEFLLSGARRPRLEAFVLSLLLASDIFLPVPSSLVSTAAGFLLGFLAGAATSLAGMTVSCMIGFLVGLKFGRPAVQKLIGLRDLQEIEKIYIRFGDWVIVMARAVPVIAEASVLVAGISRMRTSRFLLLSFLSNLGISAVYAAIGAISADINSFLFAFLGSILVPLSGISLKKIMRRFLP